MDLGTADVRKKNELTDFITQQYKCMNNHFLIQGKSICEHLARYLHIIRPSNNLLLNMKITVLLIVVFSVHASASIYGQKIDLTYQNASLKTVIKALSRQGNIDFVYKDQYMEKAKPVSISMKNATVETALRRIFDGQPFDYRLEDDIVYITPKPIKERILRLPQAPELLQDTVRGRVVNEKGEPVAGASVTIKGERGKGTSTDEDGYFTLAGVDENATILISGVSIETVEVKVNGRSNLGMLKATARAHESEEIVVNTGYQQIPRERAVGSFEVIDNKLLNRSVSTNFQDRLKGVTTAIQWDNIDPTVGRIQPNPNFRSTGMTIRGVSTFMASTEPLIVIDNFPYEGELSNINPNDIEAITILRDASAASIWGARSGNGVIVITTKRGSKNEKMRFDFSSNVSVSAKPDLFYGPKFLDSKTFIDIEKELFDLGYFNSDITNSSTFPVISPSVQIMEFVRSGVISEKEGEQRLSELSQYDIRKDYEKYVYQNAINQQYALSLRGGTSNMTYRLSAGWDDNKSELVRNGFNRFSINSLNTYTPIRNIDITVGLNYAQSKTFLNNDIPNYSISGSKYTGNILPYTRLMNDEGNHLDVPYRLGERYLLQAEERGYLDWRYRPLDEINLSDNTMGVNSILAKFGVKYEIIPQLSIEINYQNEQQRISDRNHRNQDTYYVRDLINKFTVYNPSTEQLTYNFPMGGMLNTSSYFWVSNILRGQVNYSREIGKHAIYAITGTEVRELKTDGVSQTFIGYDDQFGTSVSNLNFNTSYPTSPSGSARLPGIGGNISGILNRFNSIYVYASYIYAQKYLVSFSARRDGANLFGAKANDRFTPLWSAGIGWNVSNEHFYNFDFLPYLKLRATYGYNGNTYSRGISLLTGRYLTELFTGAQSLVNLTAPNSQLRWERIKNINVGIDFRSKRGIISGYVEYYIKNGLDLVQPTSLAPQTGFETYTANTASSRTKGWDLNLSSRVIDREIKWNTTLLLSVIKDKVVKYDVPYTSILTRGGMEGKPMKAIFAYKWGGLNAETGAPVGFLDGEKSENYSAINSKLSAEDLIYAGSGIPTTFGSWRNDFSYKNIHLSFNVLYYMGYVFKRASMNTNLTAQITSSAHTDYFKRWQAPGDEQSTNVPSLVYPNNSARNTFYTYSEALITPADHIRFQDVRIGYDFSKIVKLNNSRLMAFVYANNLGIIWRKNKVNLDPETMSSYPKSKIISFGINANF